MKKYFLSALILIPSLVYAHQRTKDGVTEFAKWKCTKYNFYAYTDQERDAYISANSVSSNTLKTSDFVNVSPSQAEVDAANQRKEPTYKRIEDLEARIKALESR